MKPESAKPDGSVRQPFSEPIAIVGIGGVFPSARTLDEFWQLIESGTDTAKPAPKGRWILDPKSIQDPRPGMPDRVYTDRGCFIEGFSLDASRYDLPADLINALDPVCHLLLEAGLNAFESAKTESIDRKRVGVIVGNIALPTASSSALCDELLTPLLAKAALGMDVPMSGRTDPHNRYVAGLPAGFLARALRLGGGTSTLDAACASSLYALKLACDELLAGRADAMLAGGVSRPDSLYTQMGFSQLRALATSGRCTPFDAAGSGLIVGEGAGVVVLKRLSDALRDGDDIHALIRGVGLSNDLDGNLLSPATEGQLRALKIAYQQAGWTPDMVDLIECHATGTPVGDAVEFESLSNLWQHCDWKTGQCALGAVKANIGHLLTGAGAAGLIKVLLALKHQTLPPVANFQKPSSKISLSESPFRVLRESQPWARRDEHTPRRAAINGFGFGGINAHVLIEEWMGKPVKIPEAAEKVDITSTTPTSSEPIAIIGMGVHIGPWPDLDAFREFVFNSDAGAKPKAREVWRGLDVEALSRADQLAGANAAGYFLGDIEIPVNRYRIPPNELSQLLPQQAIMLEVAREALANAKLKSPDPHRTGVFIGLGLDLRTTDFHFRWAMIDRARQWVETHLKHVSGEAREQWIREVIESAGPALNADRTMGALAGTNASRIAKEFHFGGQSYNVCSEDASGLRALELAVRALQQGELDQALAGGVELTGDLRTLLATQALRAVSKSGGASPFDQDSSGVVPGEGAVGLVLKRLKDAVRDGDRVYAVIRGVGAASGTGAGKEAGLADTSALAIERACNEAGVTPQSIGWVETHGSGDSAKDAMEAEALIRTFDHERRFACHLGSSKAQVGHTGAASGLVSIVRASLALHHQVIPAASQPAQPVALLRDTKRLNFPATPQQWIHDRTAGPRRAGVNALSVDGNALHVVLEEAAECQHPDVPVSQRNEALFAFYAADSSGLQAELEKLKVRVQSDADGSLDDLAVGWWSEGRGVARGPLTPALSPDGGEGAKPSTAKCSLAIVSNSREQLLRLIDSASLMLSRGEASPTQLSRSDRDRVFFAKNRLQGGIAFVYPGAGSHFAEMGRELALQFPAVLQQQDSENAALASQMFIDRFWNAPGKCEMTTDHRAGICGQVAMGTLTTDLVRSFGVQPQAAIGYSLGESTSLFAMRAWTARDDMLQRVTASPLFQKELTGLPETLRRGWNVPDDQPVQWKAGIVDRGEDAVRKALKRRKRTYLLIINTPEECVIGGNAPEVDALLADLKCHWFPLEGVSTVHCELLKPVEPAYRELHLFPTTAPAGVTFYSGGLGRSYVPDRDTAADAIVAQASHTVDFPKVIREAYATGIRLFIEMGPGNSCSRMIGKILEGQPHFARSVCPSAKEPLLDLLRVVGELIAQGVPVNLDALYPQGLLERAGKPVKADEQAVPVIRIPITGPAIRPPALPPHVAADVSPLKLPPAESQSRLTSTATNQGEEEMRPIQEASSGLFANTGSAETADPFEAELLGALAESQAATIQAHEAYLNFSQNLFRNLSESVAEQLELVGKAEQGGGGRTFEVRRDFPVPLSPRGGEGVRSVPQISRASEAQRFAPPSIPPRALNREQCMEFAIGRIGNVLGKMFADIDAFPTRVRLPDTPLMLVDRILEIEGEPCSMTNGRVVTEHDIHPGAWYLDCGRIPTCIAVEAGQADLFLSGYLGIDFKTRGLSMYRLLDARVCFHRSLPGPGEVIHYNIRIDHFFRQGDTWLFRFNFESTVNGEPLLSMTDGCAGFFSERELAGGKGVVRTALQLQKQSGKRPADWEDFVPMAIDSYSGQQLDALRAGDFVACFGEQFAGLSMSNPVTLPSGRMKLVHRIVHLDPTGGRFGIGLVRGEADIHPSDWFLTCHFVDDRVMPGTLMYECCLHTLRVHLLRMGWVVNHGEGIALEPVPGLVGQLKCRGQVLESTKVVTYEIEIKEIGYRPEPYVVADALMYADGKAIVEIGNMSLRYTGVTREMLRETWREARTGGGHTVSRALPPHPGPLPRGGEGVEAGSTVSSERGRPRPRESIVADSRTKASVLQREALFGPQHILAFSNGKPSEGFGEPYRIFDEQRRIARLPGPPYQFLDRIVHISGCEAFKMVAGGVVEAEYDVPVHEWYFAANRQRDMSFAVLLEIALQPCGWLSAYIGSALTSEEDLSYRNLGGSGTQFIPVRPEIGTLTIRIKNTRLSSSAGMIIQWFDFEVHGGGQLVYKGDTYFGFFPKAALEKQEGIKGARLYAPTEAETARSRSLPYPTDAPFADTQLRMVDDITLYVPDGGTKGLGFIRGTKRVVAEEWFFKAHFYQDPVVPGSLGLESFLQLLKFVAVDRWGHTPGSRWEAVAMNRKHEWTYRGQVIPRDHLVSVEAVITGVDEASRALTADGFLSVDGRVIYAMKDFTVREQHD